MAIRCFPCLGSATVEEGAGHLLPEEGTPAPPPAQARNRVNDVFNPPNGPNIIEVIRRVICNNPDDEITAQICRAARDELDEEIRRTCDNAFNEVFLENPLLSD